jgi:hypothetical protein
MIFLAIRTGRTDFFITRAAFFGVRATFFTPRARPAAFAAIGVSPFVAYHHA